MRCNVACLCLILGFTSSQAPLACAQVAEAPGTVVVAAARSALVDAVERLDTALSNQAGNVQSLGESLKGDATALLSDFDARLQGKLQYTFSQLTQQEQQVFNDSQALADKIDAATQALTSKTQVGVRQSLGEADILAYNALYSLPCRSQIPRIVYANPERVAANDLHEAAFRGNFLSIGDPLSVTVDGVPAGILSRSANEMRISIPEVVFKNLEHERSVSIEIPTSQTNRTNLWVTCWESVGKGPRLLTSVRVVPGTRVDIRTRISAVAELPSESFDVPYGDDENNDDCNANYNATKQFSVPEDAKLTGFSQPALSCTRCGSGVNNVRQIGDKAIVVDAHFQACGTDCVNLGFTKVCNCKGRGCLKYSGQLHAVRSGTKQLDAQATTMTVQGLFQRSFIVAYEKPIPPDAKNIKWLYEAEVTETTGSSVRRYIVSDSSPIASGIMSRIGSDGKLNLEVSQLPQ